MLNLSFQKKTLVKILVFIFVFLMNIQLTYKFTLPHNENLKLFHLFSIILILLFFLYEIEKPSLKVILFFMISFISSCIALIVDGEFNILFINYIYGLYIYFVGKVTYKALGNDIYKLYKNTMLITIGLIIIKLFFNYQSVLDYLRAPFGHPRIDSFYGGGLNIESTWIGISTVLFLKSKWFYPLYVINLSIALLYGSRVATIVMITILIYKFVSKGTSNKTRLVIVLIIILIPSFTLFLNPYALERFTSIGEDPGSVGRLTMWQYIDDAFWTHPILGSGAGNTISLLEKISGMEFIETNIHNYFIQVLLDFGICGFIFWILIFLKTTLTEKKNKFSGNFGGFLILFFISSLVEFRGAEPIFWFIYGVYEAEMSKKRPEIY